jgi:hypothetical protein
MTDVIGLCRVHAPLLAVVPGGAEVRRPMSAAASAAAVVVISLGFGGPPRTAAATLCLADGALLIQVTLVRPRPRLSRRSQRIIASVEHAPRSRGHHAYVLLEGVKALALLAGGVLVLAAH